MKTLMEAMDNLKKKDITYSSKQEYYDFLSKLDKLGMYPGIKEKSEVTLAKDDAIIRKLAEYQNIYRVHFYTDIEQPHWEDYIKVTVLGSSKRIPTKENLLKLVTNKNIVDKDILWNLVYYFEDSGFYREDKRRSKRQFIYDCIDNCYKGNIGIYYKCIQNEDTVGTSRETSDDSSNDILDIFEKLNLIN